MSDKKQITVGKNTPSLATEWKKGKKQMVKPTLDTVHASSKGHPIKGKTR